LVIQHLCAGSRTEVLARLFWKVMWEFGGAKEGKTGRWSVFITGFIAKVYCIICGG